jgi:hypothetical protein
MEVPRGASFRFVNSRRILRSFRSCFFRVCASLDPCLPLLCPPAAGVGGRARERYGTLDRLDAELRWYREQYNALDALVEALRTPGGWQVYQVEALRDQPPELDAPAAEDISAVERVKIVLVDRDEALYKAREDLAGARTVAAEWEAEVASVRAQLQQDRATLEGARAWQSQAEERAKEAE